MIGVEQLAGENMFQVKIQWTSNGSFSNHTWDSVLSDMEIHRVPVHELSTPNPRPRRRPRQAETASSEWARIVEQQHI